MTRRRRQHARRVRSPEQAGATSPESVANFLYTWNGAAEAFAVKKEQEFSLKPQEDVKYKLLEVEPGKVIIIDTQKPNDKIEIGPAKQ
jgi:hypothetical protein